MKNLITIIFSALIFSGCNSQTDSSGMNPYDESSENSIAESAEPSSAPQVVGPSAEDIQNLKDAQK